MKLSNTFQHASACDETATVAMSPAYLPTLSEGLRQEAAVAELFEIPETKSPRLRWMESHHLSVEDRGESASSARRYRACLGLKTIGYGSSVNDALVSAAKSLNIPLWNEV